MSILSIIVLETVWWEVFNAHLLNQDFYLFFCGQFIHRNWKFQTATLKKNIRAVFCPFLILNTVSKHQGFYKFSRCKKLIHSKRYLNIWRKSLEHFFFFEATIYDTKINPIYQRFYQFLCCKYLIQSKKHLKGSLYIEFEENI